MQDQKQSWLTRLWNWLKALGKSNAEFEAKLNNYFEPTKEELQNFETRAAQHKAIAAKRALRVEQESIRKLEWKICRSVYCQFMVANPESSSETAMEFALKAAKGYIACLKARE